MRQSENIVAMLRRKPGLLWEVLSQTREDLVVGPWTGRRYDPDWNQKKIVTEWVRLDPSGKVIAAVYDDGPNRMGHRQPLWVALPREISLEDQDTRHASSRFYHTDTENSVRKAQQAADHRLKGAGYAWAGEARLVSPWVEKANHWCRDIMLGSHRPRTSHQKLAVVRKKGSYWAWVVLLTKGERQVAEQGTEVLLAEAQQQVDTRLHDLGWDLLERS